MLSDLVGPPICALLLVQGIQTYRDGGSIGWPVAGAVLLLVTLYTAGRRFVRYRGRKTTAPSSS